MKIEPGTMCMGCGDNPATTADKTVPLCGSCAALAKGKGRGVTVKKTRGKSASV